MPRHKPAEKHYCVYYVNSDGTGTQQLHETKEENDRFADAMNMMGVTEITKSFYNPTMCEWFRYHKEDRND